MLKIFHWLRRCGVLQHYIVSVWIWLYTFRLFFFFVQLCVILLLHFANQQIKKTINFWKGKIIIVFLVKSKIKIVKALIKKKTNNFCVCEGKWSIKRENEKKCQWKYYIDSHLNTYMCIIYIQCIYRQKNHQCVHT